VGYGHKLDIQLSSDIFTVTEQIEFFISLETVMRMGIIKYFHTISVT